MEETELTKNEVVDGGKVRNLNLLLSILFVCVIAWVGINLFNLFGTKRDAYQLKLAQEAQLRREVESVKEKNDNLEQRKKYLSTRQGVEQVARDKLGMIKPSEIPFIVYSEEEQAAKSEEESALSKAGKDSSKNKKAGKINSDKKI